ncbi:MAG: hypothetical protein OSJ45_11755 [Lachnospiraceae bacterium]|nr:hypothetical protein [Lachnospiraceae bacterium]
MRIKRVLQGTALTALAAAAWMGAGSADASAAVDTTNLVKAADGSYQLQVTTTGNDIEVMAAVVKPNKNGGVKITAWDVHEGSTANIDLSKLNVANDNYIALKTDSMDEPIFVGIAAASKKNKVTFNAGTAKVTNIDTTVVKTTTTGYTGAVEYRTANGNWAAFNRDNALTGYQHQGATLYLRVPANTKAKTNITDGLIDITNDKKNTKKLDIRQVGSLPGKETKLNIGKQANGPRVAVDYVKGTVTIPKSAEYRVVANASTSAAVGTTSDKAEALTPGAILGKANSDSGVLEVRKAAVTNTAKGKAASKWTRVELKMPKAVTIEKADVATSSSVKAKVSGGAIELQYTVDKKKVANGGLTFKNTAGFSVDYFVGSAAPTGYDKAIKAVKDTKTVTIKKLKDGDKIFVRVSGDKTKTQWAGAWGELLTVAMPK